MLWKVIIMRISEFSKQTGLSKKTIHFYIEKGLLNPSKEENDYYSFSKKDLEDCKQVQLLRNLGIPIAKIKQFKEYPGSVNYFLYTTVRQLKKEITEKQVQIENIFKILQKLPPNATPDLLSPAFLDTLSYHPEHPMIETLYPLNSSYLIACFLFAPYVNVTPNTYRRYLWERISEELSNQLQDSVSILESIMYNLDIHVMSRASAQVYRLVHQTAEDHLFQKLQQHLIARCHELLENEEFQSKWKILYHPVLRPLLKFYQSSSSLLFEEYNIEFKEYLNNLEKIIQSAIEKMQEGGFLKKFDENTQDFFKIEDSLYSDFFILFTFKESFYSSYSSEDLKNLINHQ